MATDPFFLERMRYILKARNINWIEKRMFGGNCFMVDDKMCFGTYRGGMMVRVPPEEAEELANREGAEHLIHGGRAMKGFLFIEPDGYDMDEDLEFWIGKCLEFNPRAKSSKRK